MKEDGVARPVTGEYALRIADRNSLWIAGQSVLGVPDTWFSLLEHPDLDTPEAGFIAVVLQQQMPLRCFPEIFPDLIFTDSDQVPVSWGAPFIFQYFHTIQIVLYVVIGIDDDAARIPLPDGVNEALLLICRDQVV